MQRFTRYPAEGQDVLVGHLIRPIVAALYQKNEGELD
jgi:hypothetical protein